MSGLFMNNNVTNKGNNPTTWNININNTFIATTTPIPITPTMSDNEYWEYVMENIDAPCCGVIVFEFSENTHKCVIVKTHKGNVGFPKGSKKKEENVLMCAIRELKEETGINFSQLLIAKKTIFKEFSNKGKLSTVYFLAKFIKKSNTNSHIFTCNPDELFFTGLLSLDESTKGMSNDRKLMLENAYKTIINPKTEFIEGENILNMMSEYNNKVNNKVNNKKSEDNKNIKISKSLSWILRHGAIEMNLNIDSSGRILLSDLLSLKEFKGITVDKIKEVVKSNDKQRFSLDIVNGNLMIKANQGHSKNLSSVMNENEYLEEITTPLNKCIHGTNLNAWKTIKKEGLRNMNRMHIHCAISEPEDGQVISGMRLDTKVLIYIDMELAMKNGIKFYLSKNKVILTEGTNGLLEPKYFKNVVFR